MTKMDDFLKLIQQLRATSSELILSSAVIVGFPSETREELEETIQFCDQAGYNTVACHMFSQRPGNPSNDMPDQISQEEKVWRYRHFQSRFKGKTRIDPNQRPLVGDSARYVTTSDVIAAMHDQEHGHGHEHGHEPHGKPQSDGLVQLRLGRKPSAGSGVSE
jgi:tRNA A37 methylthiotransferase MiaB